jgi:hypothetical protein
VIFYRVCGAIHGKTPEESASLAAEQLARANATTPEPER